MVKTFKQFLKESTKQQLVESTLPKETSLNLSLDETGYKYLDDNYEQSYFEVSLDMIKSMIKSVKSQSDRDWASAMGETEKEAHEERQRDARQDADTRNAAGIARTGIRARG